MVKHGPFHHVTQNEKELCEICMRQEKEERINSYYECHVTFLPAFTVTKDSIKEDIERTGWRFSAIDGDIIQGPGVKYYATIHFNISEPLPMVMAELFKTAETIKYWGYDVTRRKIEHVIYDDRSSKICPPDCSECIKD